MAAVSQSEMQWPKHKHGGCCYIDGDPLSRNYTWCNAPVRNPGESWCLKHHAIVFVPKSANPKIERLTKVVK